MLNTSRLIRWQYRRGGLIHLVTCYDHEPSYHVVHGPTLCGRTTHPGQGGWGYDGKQCGTCWTLGSPAERIPR